MDARKNKNCFFLECFEFHKHQPEKIKIIEDPKQQFFNLLHRFSVEEFFRFINSKTEISEMNKSRNI